MTKAFWKPLSANTIFVTQDNTTKRRDYEEQVMKVFYLTNVNTPQELQEIVTAVRSVADIQRLFVYNAQNAIIARGEADRIALAEKIIHDLDKPKSEVVVDVVVLQASSDMTRTLGAALNTLNMPINFTPRTSISTPSTSTHHRLHFHAEPDTTGHHRRPGRRRTTATATSIPLAYIGKVDYAGFLDGVAGRPAGGRAERQRHAHSAIAADARRWTTRRPRSRSARRSPSPPAASSRASAAWASIRW